MVDLEQLLAQMTFEEMRMFCATPAQVPPAPERSLGLHPSS